MTTLGVENCGQEGEYALISITAVHKTFDIPSLPLMLSLILGKQDITGPLLSSKVLPESKNFQLSSFWPEILSLGGCSCQHNHVITISMAPSKLSLLVIQINGSESPDIRCET